MSQAAAMRRLSEDVKRRFGRPRQTNIKVQRVYFHQDRPKRISADTVNVSNRTRRPNIAQVASSYFKLFTVIIEKNML